MGGLPADQGSQAEEAQRAAPTWCPKPLVVHDIRVLAEALWSIRLRQMVLRESKQTSLNKDREKKGLYRNRTFKEGKMNYRLSKLKQIREVPFPHQPLHLLFYR